jgi:hypothetical protein
MEDSIMYTAMHMLNFLISAEEPIGSNTGGGSMSLVPDAFIKTGPMCFFSFAFFVLVAIMAMNVRIRQLNFHLPSGFIAYSFFIIWVILSGICLTLIDKPHFDMTPVMKDWLFMFSAFLGIPVTVPLMSGGVWALAHHLKGQKVTLSSLALISLAGFAMGCAASNIHDVVWCGVITDGYSQHHAAGYDLDLFVAFGQMFGIPREVSADYATLGPYTMVLVTGELLVAVVSLIRLRKNTCAEEEDEEGWNVIKTDTLPQ